MGWYGQILDMANGFEQVEEIRNMSAIKFLEWLSREKSVNDYQFYLNK